MKKSFKKDLKILKKIKSLNLKDNAGFPIILSAKISKNFGEILISQSGQDILSFYNLHECMETSMKFDGIQEDHIPKIAIDIAS